MSRSENKKIKKFVKANMPEHRKGESMKDYIERSVGTVLREAREQKLAEDLKKEQGR